MSEAASRPPGLLIPDCCNIGIIFRVLLAVNAAAATVALLQAASAREGLMQFMEAAMVIELACLWSLFFLCGLRQLLQRSGLAARVSEGVQRVLCVLVPAMVTGAVVHFFASVEWLASSLTHMTTLKAVLIAALLSMLLQHYFALRTRAYSPALVEARLQALQARIRPHFLFNSLNAVLSLIRTEPRQAETTLEDLADLFRVLMSDPRNMTTLENEIHLCRQYLSIEQVRLGERLQLRWETGNVDEEMMRKAQLPVLLLQPLIENAVHYGVEPVTEPVLIDVRMARSLDRIEIDVINPYHGNAAPSAGNHIAMDNIRERLALLYDVEAQLTTSISNGNFEARLRFPYVKKVS